jgi:hypothetical protein
MFGMLGGFYLSVGAVYWPGSGIAAAYTGTPDENDALGLYVRCIYLNILI